MQAPYGLNRLLYSESDWADLICYLTERDPKPLRSLFTLGRCEIEFNREYVIKGSRLDGLISLRMGSASARPVAIVEFKLGASLHGDQLAKYAEWASANGVTSLFLVGPDPHKPPNTPKTWTAGMSLPVMLDAWAQTSTDSIARELAKEASRSFVVIEEMATGPACTSFGQVPDAFRIRRLYARTEHFGKQAGVEFGRERSQSGYPNYSATWNSQKTANSATCEIQRINRGSGRFELRLMVGDETGALTGSERLADGHKRWLTWDSLQSSLPEEARNLLQLYNGSEFKTSLAGRGSKTYYGYTGVGQGSRFVFVSGVTLDQMVHVARGVLQHLSTFPG